MAPASLNTRKNCLALWRERIDNSTHGSSRALDHTVTDVLGGVHRTLCHVFRCPHRSGLSRANGNGEGENDRKQRFHSTKLFVSDASNAPTRPVAGAGRCFFAVLLKRSKMTPSELSTRSALQIFLERARFAFRFERNSGFDLPRQVLRGVRTIASVVFEQAFQDHV